MKSILTSLVLCALTSSCFAQSLVLPVLEQRHSGRAYQASKPVTTQQINTLAQAARLAPSCYNDQPWHFIFCDRTTQPQSYQKALDCLVDVNQEWAKNAPLLVIMTADTEFRHSKEPNRWGTYDTGAAAISMALQATSMGLMAHQMGGFDEKKTREVFKIPERYIPISVMAVGFEVGSDAARQAQKERRPIQDNFFVGEWGKILTE